jgi:predicted nucleic acid binding AN1-type Zn finger protein
MINVPNTSIQSSTKCSLCRKKSLVLSDCPCGNKFCLKCRFPEDHKCSFNFKERGTVELTKNNPIVAGEKISKI